MKSVKPEKVYKFTEEQRKRMSIAHLGLTPCKGRKLSKEHKRKISKSLLGNNRKLGYKHAEEFKKNQSERMKGNKISYNKFKGENNPNWKGGVSFDEYPIEWDDDLKESIRKRDNYICQLCGIHQDELDYKLHCHHIDYNKKNLNPNNLITLCIICHLKTNYNRENWIDYFNRMNLCLKNQVRYRE